MWMCGAAVCCEWKEGKRCDFQGACSNKVEVSELRERAVADVTKLEEKAQAAVRACNDAPLMVRPFLRPLREFVEEATKAIVAMNAAGGCPGNHEKGS